MKTRFLFHLVMLVALSVFAFAVPVLAEDAAVSATGIMPLLEGMLPESALTWVTFAVTICAALAVAMPAPKDGGNAIYKWIYTAVQWIALNVGRAKNASRG